MATNRSDSRPSWVKGFSFKWQNHEKVVNSSFKWAETHKKRYSFLSALNILQSMPSTHYSRRNQDHDRHHTSFSALDPNIKCPKKTVSFFVSFSSLKRTVNHLFVILSLKTETFYPGGAWVTPISCHKSHWLARTCVYIWSQSWLEVWDSERSHLARDQDCHGNIRKKNRNYSEKSEILDMTEVRNLVTTT
jgi:hypothetical protein